MKKIWKKSGWMLIAGALALGGCATKEYVASKPFAQVGAEHNVTAVTLLALRNYTDVPEAGKRAANLVAGVLRAKGFAVKEAFRKRKKGDPCEMVDDRYVMDGGVSEWRYKTGIDGEPAVSLQLTLHDCQSKKILWSATASSNDYWRASIGTTAQAVIEKMFKD